MPLLSFSYYGLFISLWSKDIPKIVVNFANEELKLKLCVYVRMA